MKLRVCFVCLKTFDTNQNLESSGESKGAALLTKFVKFAVNYLQVSTSATQQLLGIDGGGGGEEYFCEKCELAVVNPICQVYLELLSAQLRLSCELGQLGRILENTGHFNSELGVLKMKALANQLGMEDVAGVEQFRWLLTQKCKLLSYCFYLSLNQLMFPVSNFHNGHGQ